MHDDVRPVAVVLSEQILHLRGPVVSLMQGDVAVHEDVELDGIVVTDASGAQVVGLHDIWHGGCQSQDLRFHLVGQGLLHEVADAAAEEVDGDFHDEETHDDGCHRVEHRPPLSQEDGPADADGRADGRERVAAVMPCVGLDSLRLELASLHHRVPIDRLLQHDGQQGRPQRQHARSLQGLPLQARRNLHHTIIQDADGHGEQRHADDGHRQRLVLAVTVVVRLVLRLAADAHEDEHDDIRHEVARRVDSIRQHRRTMSHDARHELEEQQHHVHRAAHHRHPVDAAFPLTVYVPVSFHLPIVLRGKGTIK